jgi:hypothetical protein
MPFEIFNEEKLDFLCQEKKAEWERVPFIDS